MFKLVLAVIFLVLSDGARIEAADKVKMGFPDLAAPFLPLPANNLQGSVQVRRIV
jgi:hypothetical protein